ncbi:MAG TPA: replication-relaxation family protein [Frankiaceae bacterium]|nr:replication-relaxation family protein [Frankiaceae bacterium]
MADLRYVTGKQLQVLHFDGDHHSAVTAARTCRRVLERLTDLGVLRRLERTVGGVRAGSSGFVYGLGPAGHHLLHDGQDRRGFREPSTTFLSHMLAVAGLVATLVNADKQDRCQLLHTETEPACWRLVPADYGAPPDTLRPDLMAIVARGEVEWHWFIEVDLATEHGPAITRKCRHYQRYFDSGREQADRGIFPKVAWLTTTNERAERLRAICNEVSPDVPLFEVGLLGDPLPTLVPEGGR